MDTGALDGTRRVFLEQATMLPIGGALHADVGPQKLAAIVCGYALRWHLHNIVTRLLEG